MNAPLGELEVLEGRRAEARTRCEALETEIQGLTATLATIKAAIAEHEERRDEAMDRGEENRAQAFEAVAAKERLREAAARYRLHKLEAALAEAQREERAASEAHGQAWSSREVQKAAEARRDRLAGIPARCEEMIGRIRSLQRDLGALLIDAGDDSDAWAIVCGIADVLEAQTLAAGESYAAVRGSGLLPGPLVVAPTFAGPAQPFTTSNGVRVDPFSRRPR